MGYCLLLEADRSIVRDVQTSLKLIDLDVKVAKSVDAAKGIVLDGEPPRLVFVRPALPDDEQAGVKLAQNIKIHPLLRSCPVVLLRHKEEMAHLNSLPKNFDAELFLPVAFPSFTKEVRSLIEHFRENPIPQATEAEQLSMASSAIEPRGSAGGSRESSAGGFADEQSEDVAAQLSGGAPGGEVDTPTPNMFLSRRLMIAYGIHIAVLDRLRQSSEFATAPLEELPAIVQRVTDAVVSDFDAEKL
ncbi:MAG: hypothetical protein KDD64_09610 [Bdellovibrionales bacterium]|nr:hypothetical protein [Bdellovibrionales bacterium]